MTRHPQQASSDARQHAWTGSLPYLYTPARAAHILSVKESWLRRQAGRRVIPCTFVGRHLRFSAEDLHMIAQQGSCQPRASRAARRTNSG